jgi:hypothetical protein
MLDVNGAVLTLLGGAAAAWPLAARTQQGERMRRVGVLMSVEENDPEGKTQLSQFMQGLAESGWTDGRNLRMEVRWGGGDVNRTRTFAKARNSGDCGAATGNPHDPDRIRDCCRSGWPGIRGRPSAAWRKHHRVYQFRSRDRGQDA